jgi:SNF family Na+-dependent transporter
MAPVTPIEIRFQYERRRRARIAILVVFVASVAVIVWSMQHLSPVPFFTGAVGLLAFAVMDFVVWRCPNCRRSLGKAFDYLRCPNCAASFTSDEPAA